MPIFPFTFGSDGGGGGGSASPTVILHQVDQDRLGIEIRLLVPDPGPNWSLLTGYRNEDPISALVDKDGQSILVRWNEDDTQQEIVDGLNEFSEIQATLISGSNPMLTLEPHYVNPRPFVLGEPFGQYKEVYLDAIARFENPTPSTARFLSADAAATGLDVHLGEPLEYGGDGNDWTLAGRQRYQGIAAEEATITRSPLPIGDYRGVFAGDPTAPPTADFQVYYNSVTNRFRSGNNFSDWFNVVNYASLGLVDGIPANVRVLGLPLNDVGQNDGLNPGNAEYANAAAALQHIRDNYEAWLDYGGDYTWIFYDESDATVKVIDSVNPVAADAPESIVFREYAGGGTASVGGTYLGALNNDPDAADIPATGAQHWFLVNQGNRRWRYSPVGINTPSAFNDATLAQILGSNRHWLTIGRTAAYDGDASVGANGRFLREGLAVDYIRENFRDLPQTDDLTGNNATYVYYDATLFMVREITTWRWQQPGRARISELSAADDPNYRGVYANGAEPAELQNHDIWVDSTVEAILYNDDGLTRTLGIGASARDLWNTALPGFRWTSEDDYSKGFFDDPETFYAGVFYDDDVVAVDEDRVVVFYDRTDNKVKKVIAFNEGTLDLPALAAEPVSVEIDTAQDILTIGYNIAAGGVLTEADTLGPIKAAIDAVTGLESEYFGGADADTAATLSFAATAQFAGGSVNGLHVLIGRSFARGAEGNGWELQGIERSPGNDALAPVPGTFDFPTGPGRGVRVSLVNLADAIGADGNRWHFFFYGGSNQPLIAIFPNDLEIGYQTDNYATTTAAELLNAINAEPSPVLDDIVATYYGGEDGTGVPFPNGDANFPGAPYHTQENTGDFAFTGGADMVPAVPVEPLQVVVDRELRSISVRYAPEIDTYVDSGGMTQGITVPDTLGDVKAAIDAVEGFASDYFDGADAATAAGRSVPWFHSFDGGATVEISIGGFALGPQQSVFGANNLATKADAAALRDAYAVLNPNWRNAYLGDQGLWVALEWAGGAAFQSLGADGVWRDVTIALSGRAGFDGWAPVLAVIVDGNRRVLRVMDWTGGSGSKPVAGIYLGAAGFVSAIADATDIAGGAAGAGTSILDLGAAPVQVGSRFTYAAPTGYAAGGFGSAGLLVQFEIGTVVGPDDSDVVIRVGNDDYELTGFGGRVVALHELVDDTQYLALGKGASLVLMGPSDGSGKVVDITESSLPGADADADGKIFLDRLLPAAYILHETPHAGTDATGDFETYANGSYLGAYGADDDAIRPPLVANERNRFFWHWGLHVFRIVVRHIQPGPFPDEYRWQTVHNVGQTLAGASGVYLGYAEDQAGIIARMPAVIDNTRRYIGVTLNEGGSHIIRVRELDNSSFVAAVNPFNTYDFIPLGVLGTGGGQTAAQVNAAIQAAITALIDGAPADRNTLAELSAAISVLSGAGGLRFGDGVPDQSLGSDGESYLDRTVGGIYLKIVGAWALQYIDQIGGGGGLTSAQVQLLVNATMLSALQGQVTDGQIPNAITRDSELTAAINALTLAAISGQLTDGQIPASITRDTELAAAVAALVDSSPGALNTLNELAAALGDDPNFATTITAALAARAQLTGADFTDAVSIASVGDTTALTVLGLETDSSPVLSMMTNDIGAQKAFQARRESDGLAFVSFEGTLGGGNGNPGLALGPGTSGRDVNLYREGADHLKTDNQFTAASLVVEGAAAGITPTADEHFATKAYVDNLVAGPAQDHNSYVALSPDTDWTAAEAQAGTSGQGNALPVPPYAGAPQHWGYFRPSSVGPITAVFIYAQGSPNTNNQISAWTVAPAVISIGGEDHNYVYSNNPLAAPVGYTAVLEVA